MSNFTAIILVNLRIWKKKLFPNNLLPIRYRKITPSELSQRHFFRLSRRKYRGVGNQEEVFRCVLTAGHFYSPEKAHFFPAGTEEIEVSECFCL